ncbi:MAG: CRISPR-associated endonuclease Cas3'' [Acidobacteriota bacterium]
MTAFFAHSAPSRSDWEPLSRHLSEVACRAEAFAAPFGAGDEARLAGLLHDLGKYSDRFTRRLEGTESGLDHWSIGALASAVAGKANARAAALAIHGHHVGLQSPEIFQTLQVKPAPANWTEADPRKALDLLAADGLALPELAGSIYDRKSPPGGAMVDVRMLFSALVDADFLATEEHFQRFEPFSFARPQGQVLDAVRALSLVKAEIEKKSAASDAAPTVRALRNDLLDACLGEAVGKQGVFTLTAPTGSGKTLAMLAFALRHAQAHNLRRIVFAVPYVSIIEQTAKIYRDLFAPTFGEDFVLEHHSLAGLAPDPMTNEEPSEEEQRRRLLAQNWDAPIVLTTNVQLLESLFANRPSACRKLHALADSVILFDEAQTIRPDLAVPTLAALSRLTERYGATVVFATATQPAFDHLDTQVRPFAAQGWAPREIVAPGLGLFARVQRTRPVWDLDRPKSWPEIAAEIAAQNQGLAIVNLKRHARDLAAAVKVLAPEGLFHLSTNLCPAHRERVLADVRKRLVDGLPCRLIATQCVEAGVDVDFPTVWRAFGPLESIAQAAGRCNRNGRREEPGEVRIFLPEDEGFPPGAYAQAARATRTLIENLGTDAIDLDDPALYRRYYRDFFDGSRIAEGNAELFDAIRAHDFAEVARLYRLIEKDAIEVLVPYDLEAFAALRDEVTAAGRPFPQWMKKARRHVVSLYRPKRNDEVWSVLAPLSAAPRKKGERDERLERDEWFVLTGAGKYDPQLLGFVGWSGSWIT